MKLRNFLAKTETILSRGWKLVSEYIMVRVVIELVLKYTPGVWIQLDIIVGKLVGCVMLVEGKLRPYTAPCS